MKKLTIEKIKENAKKVASDYKLKSTVYVGAHKKLEWVCPKNHTFWTSSNSFKNGSRCPECAGNKKLTIEKIREKTKKVASDYKLKSTVYVSIHEKLEWVCPKNHTFWASSNSFINKGSRCPICAGLKKHTIEYVRKYIEGFGWKLLSKIYKNAMSKLKVECPSGHQYEVIFSSFKNGSRCPECAGNIKHTIEKIREKTKKVAFDYKLLSKVYVSIHEKLEWVCPKNHTFWASFNNFINKGSRCPQCAAEKTSSKGEKEVSYFVKSLIQHDIDIVLNDRTQILNPKTGYNLELDVYIPSMKKAIEYNGIYWHDSFEAKQKDEFKKQECKRLGIDLLIVNEANWLNNQESERKIIEKFLTF